MKILITKPVGAFENVDGRLVNPNPGEEVEVSLTIGNALIELEAAEGLGDGTTDDPPPEPDATPQARQQAEEAGLDLRSVSGTGDDGRIIVADVQKALKDQEDSAARKAKK